MSFFSGFQDPYYNNGDYIYIPSLSETMGTVNISIVAIGSGIIFYNSIKTKKNFDMILSIIFFILAITIIIIYYIQRNIITEIYIKNEKTDENLNKIYFSLTIVITFIYFYYVFS